MSVIDMMANPKLNCRFALASTRACEHFEARSRTSLAFEVPIGVAFMLWLGALLLVVSKTVAQLSSLPEPNAPTLVLGALSGCTYLLLRVNENTSLRLKLHRATR